MIIKNKDRIDMNILNGRYENKSAFENYKKLKNILPLKLIDIQTKGWFLYLIFNNSKILTCGVYDISEW